jgi:hypothetical protein
MELLFKHLERTIGVAGDICEFGCFRGLTSIKMAFFVQALRLPKKVYAFDTFSGFVLDDPSGGPMRIGGYSDTYGAYDELIKWSRVLPLEPIKGDAREMCGLLKNPISFVWLDMDMGVMMGPVLHTIWHLLSRDSLIAVDDVGRPETPTVKPWLDDLIARGQIKVVEEYPGECMGIYRKAEGRDE